MFARLEATGAAFAILIAASPWPAGAAEDGEKLFLDNCGVCHTLNKDDPPRQGPVLLGVVGRKAGSIPEFPYSNGLKNAGFDWTPELIETWIADPQAVIQDSYMLYNQPDSAIRAAIAAYLAGKTE